MSEVRDKIKEILRLDVSIADEPYTLVDNGLPHGYMREEDVEVLSGEIERVLENLGYRQIPELTVLDDYKISEILQRDTNKWAVTNKEFLMDCAHVISKAQRDHDASTQRGS